MASVASGSARVTLGLRAAMGLSAAASMGAAMATSLRTARSAAAAAATSLGCRITTDLTLVVKGLSIVASKFCEG